MQGAGGGAAGARAGQNQPVANPGAAGGGYSESNLSVVALGAVETVVVGAGGPTSYGRNGGNSSFGGLVTATGGSGGQAAMIADVTPACFSGTPGPLAGSGQIVMGGGAGRRLIPAVLSPGTVRAGR